MSPRTSPATGSSALSDHEIQTRIYEIKGDPRLEPTLRDQLLEQVPPGDELDRIEQAYEYKKEKLPCAVCHRALHFKGFVCRLGSGRRVLVGIDCGEEQFGAAAWGKHMQGFEYERARRDYLREIKPLRDRVAAARDALVHWGRPLIEMVTFHRSLRQRIPDLYSLLLDAARKNGRLEVTERRRDLLAEHASRSGGARWSDVIIFDRPLRGAQFILGGGQGGPARAESEALERALGSKDPASMTNAEMRKQLTDIDGIAQRLEQTWQMYREYVEFCGAPARRDLEQFVGTHPQLRRVREDGRYTFNRNGIRWKRGADIEILPFPTPAGPLPRDPIDWLVGGLDVGTQRPAAGAL